MKPPFLVLVVLLVAAEPPGEEGLQGNWRLVALEEGGKRQEVPFDKAQKLTVTADRIQGVVREGKPAEMAYTLDPTKIPKAIDLAYVADGKKGDAFRAIYRREGDALTICFLPAVAGEKDGKRPNRFITKGEGGGQFLWVLRRDKD
jgi:uncharacterized protein (TIGR03067 family)